MDVKTVATEQTLVVASNTFYVHTCIHFNLGNQFNLYYYLYATAYITWKGYVVYMVVVIKYLYILYVL